MDFHFQAFLTLLVMVSTCAGVPTIYLYDKCNGDYSVDKDVRIKLLPERYLSMGSFDCTMKLSVTTGSRLVARFKSYTRGETSIFSSKCDKQGIYLNSFFDSTSGYCNLYRPSESFELGTRGTYRYRITPDPSSFFTQVNVAHAELIVTEVTNKTGNVCPDGFFDCERSNACIDDDLTCNGYDDCGNDRDEIEGCGLTKGAIIGIVCGVIAFLIIAAVGIACFVKHR